MGGCKSTSKDKIMETTEKKIDTKLGKKEIFRHKCFSLLFLKCLYEANEYLINRYGETIGGKYGKIPPYFYFLAHNYVSPEMRYEFLKEKCIIVNDLMHDYDLSEINDILDMPSKKIPFPKLLRFLREQRIDFEEGQKFSYGTCNSHELVDCYLGQIILCFDLDIIEVYPSEISIINNYIEFIDTL